MHLNENKLHLPRIMLAAPKSGSGKTYLTCALLRLLARRGHKPTSFKCGPDYIDPMFHSKVLNTPSKNLDTFFTGRDLTRCLFQEMAVDGDIAVIEGVMGYFDGMGQDGFQASSFDLARVTESPVILCVDAKGMGHSIVPLVKGFLDYEEALLKGKALNSNGDRHHGISGALGEDKPLGINGAMDGDKSPGIKGVILNRVTAGTYQMMKHWIEEELGIKALGFLPVMRHGSWESRHLGLLLPSEIEEILSQVDKVADILEESLSLDSLFDIAAQAPDMERLDFAGLGLDLKPLGERPKIAVAMDSAFNFYYEDNIALMRKMGAEISYFSPLKDKRLPQADGYIFGGGYPELHLKELSENTSMLESVRLAACRGVPMLAECGGFMYLQESIVDGKAWTMAGVLNGRSTMTKKLVRFGYLNLEPNRRNVKQTDADSRAESAADKNLEAKDLAAANTAARDLAAANPETRNLVAANPETRDLAAVNLEAKDLAAANPAAEDSGEENSAAACSNTENALYLSEGERIRGHEFHYFDSSENGDACIASKPNGNRRWDAVQIRGNIFAGFPHLYYYSNPSFLRRFLERALEARDQDGGRDVFLEKEAGENEPEKINHFPLFMNIKGKKVLVLGGGTVATNRIRTLMNFGADIETVSMEFSPDIQGWIEEERIRGRREEIRAEKIGEFVRGFSMVLSCLNDERLNEKVVEKCRSLGILVNDASKKERCDFYFPAIIESQGLTLGVTSNGEDHKKVRRISAQIRELLGNENTNIRRNDRRERAGRHFDEGGNRDGGKRRHGVRRAADGRNGGHDPSRGSAG